MTNIQLYLSIGIPTLTVLLSLLINWSATRNLRADFTERFGGIDRRFDRMETRLDRMETRLDRIDNDMHHFYQVTGNLQGRTDALEKQR